jgi:hypothetical protein
VASHYTESVKHTLVLTVIVKSDPARTSAPLEGKVMEFPGAEIYQSHDSGSRLLH